MISSATRRARYEGMAKPRPILPPLASPELDGTVAPAVGMPTNGPAQLTIAPPLLPGLMAASVWTASTGSADWLNPAIQQLTGRGRSSSVAVAVVRVRRLGRR